MRTNPVTRSTVAATRQAHANGDVRVTPARAAIAMLLLAAAVGLGGCLGKPEIEDRWTRVDVSSSNLTPNQVLTGGTIQPVAMSTAITYRAIVTGFAVAELRASTVISPAAVALAPDAPREPMAANIDSLLANSVTMGRATRAVTGWNHLIQRIDFSFSGTVPAATDSNGNSVNLFLVCYLAEGDEVERADGSDTLIVTPFPSAPYQILPVGMEFLVSNPTP